MSKYKLMPEEATSEMEQAAEKYWNDRKFKALSDDPRTWKGLYAAMRAAAPDVQGEPVALAASAQKPVGYVSQDFLDGKWSLDHIAKSDGGQISRTIPLYAAPQPAEQQPISHDWDDQDKCRRCGDRDWYASATCTPKPHTAPDVDVLVEALTELCDEIDKHEIHAAISKTSISWFKRKARAVLAAHRTKDNGYE